MPALILPDRWRSRPNGPIELNPSHWAAGQTVFAPDLLAGGLTVMDLVSGLPNSVTAGNGPVAHGGDQNGTQPSVTEAFDFTGTGQLEWPTNETALDALTTSDGISAVMRLCSDVAPSSWAGVFCSWDTSATGNGFGVFLDLNNTVVNNGFLFRGNNGAQVGSSGNFGLGSVAANGRMETIGVACDASNYRMFARSLLVNSGTHATSIDTHSNRRTRVGGTNGFNNAAPLLNGRVEYVWAFRGFLTLDEYCDIEQAPWALVRPAIRRRYYAPTTAGGGGSIALTAAAGSFTATGQAAAMKAARKLSASAGSFALTGKDAGLTGPGAKTLTADVGTFTLTGQAVNFEVAVPAGIASYTLTGQAATLTYVAVEPNAYTLAAALAAYVLTGRGITFDTTASPWQAVPPAAGDWTRVS